jgi:hypothetical protein
MARAPAPGRRALRAGVAVLALAAVAGARAGAERGNGERPGDGGPREVVFRGACDASGAAPLSGGVVVIADDEDSLLRIYDADRGGAPLRSVDLSTALFPPKEPKKKKKRAEKGDARSGEREPAAPGSETKARAAPESDLEAGARIGDLVFWITSHGRNRSGKKREARLRFFATRVGGERDPVRFVGRSYEGLLEDLLADERYAAFELAEGSKRAPKDPGGLNIEGLAERPGGGLWVGFRNPIPGGRALVAPLLDPERILAGERARFGTPILLDLGGLGIRDLSRWRDRTLIVAGHPDEAPGSRLFVWDGRGEPRAVEGVPLDGFNPEAIFSPDARDEVLLLSDDGVLEIDGTPCKRLEDPARKRFRGRWVSPPPPPPARPRPAGPSGG